MRFQAVGNSNQVRGSTRCPVLIITVEGKPKVSLQLVMAICFGMVLAACTALFIQMVRKNPNQAKKVVGDVLVCALCVLYARPLLL